MVCFIYLIIFSITGIFNVTHRQLAKDALSCVFKNLTLRPCDLSFKGEIKGKIVGKLVDRSPFVARIFNKYFEFVSWTLFIITIGSFYGVVVGGYNYYLYGSCNGLNQSGFCVFDPSGENNKISQNAECSLEEPTESDLVLSDFDRSLFPTHGIGGKNELVFIGCYSCDYTREVYPSIKKLLNKYDIKYVFAEYPIHAGTEYLSDLNYCAYRQDEEKFWKLSDMLFDVEKEKLSDNIYVNTLIAGLGFDLDEIKRCVSDPQTKIAVEKQKMEIRQTNFYGTPTIFINDKALVGPKPYRVYKGMIK